MRVMLKCKKCDSIFYTGVEVTSESAFLGANFGVAGKDCPICKKSATYFPDDYFLEHR